MKPSRGILILITMAVCGALTWAGSGGGASAAQAQPQVVRKKIVATARPAAPKAGNPAVLQPKSAVAETRKTSAVSKTTPAPDTAPSAAPVAGIRPKSEVAATPKTNTTSATAAVRKEDQSPAAAAVNTLAAKETPPPTKPVEGRPTAEETPQTTASKTGAPEIAMATAPDKPGLPPPYDPKDKVDPFEPLFKEEPEMPKTPSNRPKRIPRTPLEKIALNQLKLVGIIVAASGNRALVQESSGKGYIIKKGTYIGTNAGKVVEIDKEKVVVEEEFTDIVGNLQLRKKEIFLPKPSGE